MKNRKESPEEIARARENALLSLAVLVAFWVLMVVFGESGRAFDCSQHVGCEAVPEPKPKGHGRSVEQEWLRQPEAGA